LVPTIVASKEVLVVSSNVLLFYRTLIGNIAVLLRDST